MTTTFYVHRIRGNREGWTRVRGERQSIREADAWIEAGWLAYRFPTSPEIRAQVRAWENRKPKGFPGETR